MRQDIAELMFQSVSVGMKAVGCRVLARRRLVLHVSYQVQQELHRREGFVVPSMNVGVVRTACSESTLQQEVGQKDRPDRGRVLSYNMVSPPASPDVARANH